MKTLFYRYILLKPENEPAKKLHVINNVQSKKVAKFGVRKLQHEHEQYNSKVLVALFIRYDVI